MYPAKRAAVVAFCLVASVLLCPSAESDSVTILTHGFQFSEDRPKWLDEMREDLADRVGKESAEWVDLVVTCDLIHGLEIQRTLTKRASGDCESIIIILDWSNVSREKKGGCAEKDIIHSTADIAPIVVDQLISAGYVEYPMHFVGHSRGVSLICETSRLLGEKGLWVEQLTSLDPQRSVLHNDAEENIYGNILFADNYWQTMGGATTPEGYYLLGTWGRELTSLEGGYHTLLDGNSHSDVHLWYHGTIYTEPDNDLFDGVATLSEQMRGTWYGVGEDEGQTTGFHYSRLGGGDRRDPSLSLGYHEDFGDGVREPIEDLTDACWPNVILLDVWLHGERLLNSGNRVAAGENLLISYWGQDRDSECTVEVYVDDDRDPSNGSKTGPISTQVHPASGSGYFNHSFAWNPQTSGVSNEEHVYLYAKVTDGPRTRYLYAEPSVSVGDEYSKPFRPLIPGDRAPLFRLIPPPDSGGSRPPIPIDSAP